MKIQITASALIVSSLIGFSALANTAFVYGKDGKVVKSFSGQCWQTREWTPSANTADCRNQTDSATVVDSTRTTTKTAPVGEKVGSLVYFKVNDAQLQANDKTRLNTLVKKLRTVAKNKKIVIEGFADPSGSAKKNQVLSLKRAEQTKNYLVAQGIAADKIETDARGEVPTSTAKAGCSKLVGKKLADCLGPDRRADIFVR